MRQKPYFDEKPDDSDTLLKYQDDQWYNTENGMVKHMPLFSFLFMFLAYSSPSLYPFCLFIRSSQGQHQLTHSNENVTSSDIKEGEAPAEPLPEVRREAHPPSEGFTPTTAFSRSV